MKKVTILALHLGFGGIERCVISLANALKDKYDVTIVSVYKLYDTPGFDIDSKVKVKYLLDTDLALKVNNYKVALTSFHVGKLIKLLWQDYFSKFKFISFIKDGFKGLKLMLNDRKKAIIDFLKNDNSDVYISTRDLLNGLLSRYGNNNSLKIAWEHSHHHGDKVYANKVINSVAGLDYFVLVSKDLKEYYCKRVKIPTIYIPNTIDELPLKLSKLNNRKLISVGRLSKEKGYIDLLKVFKLLHSYDSTFTLDIIGDGPEKDSLIDYIKFNHLDDCVTLHGFQKKKFINKMLENSSLYLMSSLTESFGIVLLEAMSYGLPCIAFSSAEGAREIIEDGKNGYLIENRSKVVMAKKIEKYFLDPDKMKKLGECARKTVNFYTMDHQKNEWINLIEKGK